MTDWREATLGDLFALDNSKLGVHSVEPTVMSLSKYDGFVRADEYFDKRIASKSLDGYKVVEPGEWAFSTIHIDEGSIARNNLGERGVISPMYTTLRWRGGDNVPEYAELLVKASFIVSEYKARAQGSINRRRSLPFKSFAAIPIALPSPDEQRRVVAIIRAVDKLVSAQAAEVSNLERVSHLMPDELLRDHPTQPLGAMLERIEGGRSPATTGVTPTLTERGVLKVSAVAPGLFIPEESKALFPHTAVPASTEVKAGDVLITRANTPDRVGAVCQVPEGVRSGLFLCDKTLRLVPDSNLDPTFLVIAMASSAARSHLTGTATGTSASMFNISQDKIRATPIPVLPLRDQQELAQQARSLQLALHALKHERECLIRSRQALVGGLLTRQVPVDDAVDRYLGNDSEAVA